MTTVSKTRLKLGYSASPCRRWSPIMIVIFRWPEQWPSIMAVCLRSTIVRADCRAAVRIMDIGLVAVGLLCHPVRPISLAPVGRIYAIGAIGLVAVG